MTALLEVTDLVKHFPVRSGAFGSKGTVRAVDGVSFSVDKGQTLGLVGESGCGKSTTGRLLMRLLDPTSGAVRLAGQDISGLRGAELQAYRRRVQMVFQNPSSALNPRASVGSAIAAPLLAQIVGVGQFAHRREPSIERVRRAAIQRGLQRNVVDGNRRALDEAI